MRILLADRLSEQATRALEAAGMSVDARPELDAAALAGHLEGCQVLVVRSTKVSATAIEAARSLSLIVRAGAGVNTIDVAAASQRGIYVANCPGQNSDAVAELALGLLIACDRRVADATADMRAGAWNKREFGQARGLRGRTLGILGLGAIGRAVAALAQSLGMKVCAWSRSLTRQAADELDIVHAATPLELARRCDAVTIHLAAAAETRHLVNAEFLAAMPCGAILVNTSRGDLIDTKALKLAIAERRLRVGLDVFEGEPAGVAAQFADVELARLATCTPHIGASTDQSSEAIATEVVRIIKVFRETGRPPNAVNICRRSPATHSLVVRHFNRVGVLAAVLDELRREGINIEEMDNAVFDGAKAACCTLQLDQQPSPELVRNLAGQPNILQVQLEPR